MSYDNINKGTLGKNKRREKDSHPEYTGKLNVGGVDYWLSAWLKTNKETGEKFFSLTVNPKGAKKKAKAESHDEFNDDIPF